MDHPPLHATQVYKPGHYNKSYCFSGLASRWALAKGFTYGGVIGELIAAIHFTPAFAGFSVVGYFES